MEQNLTNITTIESFVEESEGMKKCVNEMYNSMMKNMGNNKELYWKGSDHIQDLPSCNKYLNDPNVYPFITESVKMRLRVEGVYFKSNDGSLTNNISFYGNKIVNKIKENF